MSGNHSRYAGYGALAVFPLSVLLPAGACGAGTKFRVVYAFNDQGGSDGAQPYGNLVADKAGNFYGTIVKGGVNGQGTVFEIAPDGTETVLCSFNDDSAQ